MPKGLNLFEVLAIPITLLPMGKNSVQGSLHMVSISFLVIRQCAKEILVVLYFAIWTDKLHFLASYQGKDHSKKVVVLKDILAFSTIFIISPSGFKQVRFLSRKSIFPFKRVS